MLSKSIAFLLGIVLLQSNSNLSSLLLLFSLPVLLALFLRRWRWLVLTLFMASGASWQLLVADSLHAQQLAAELESRDVLIEGVIVTLPNMSGHARRFVFAISRMEREGKQWPSPARVRLSWYGNPPSALRAGDRWQLIVRLKRPHGMLNPGGFDYERWLFSEHIRASGYVRKNALNQRLGSDNSLLSRLSRWRQKIRHKLRKTLANADFSGIIIALAIGDRSAINEQQWQILRNTGTSHLVAISGLHIGLVAALFLWLTGRCWSLSSRLCSFWPAPQAAALGALLAATIYAALAGFSLPTQRALCMITIAVITRLLRRQVCASEILALTLIIVLLIDPLSSLNPGFWLSFIAVGLILLLSRHRQQRRHWLRVHLLLAIGLAPVLIIFFQQSPLFSPMANLIAVPFVGMAIVPLILIATLLLDIMPLLAEQLLAFTDSLLSLLWQWLQWLSQLPAGTGWYGAPPAWTLAIAMAGILLFFLPRGMPGRWLGLIALLPMLLTRPAAPQTGSYRFTLLDVGQGLAAVVQTSGHVLVYDSGPRYSRQFNAGSDIIIPFLRASGIDHIDTLIIGHGDADHIGGVTGLYRGINVEKIYSSVPEKLPWPQAKRCFAGQQWQWDGIPFHLLHPNASSNLQGNNNSCVIKIGKPGQGVLIPGDIEQAAEQQLLKENRQHLRAEIMVVPHHGSATSSTVDFISAISPRYALFASGYGNRFGLPRRTIVQRYQQRQILVLNSAYSGAISFLSSANGRLKLVSQWRRKKDLIWRSTGYFRDDRTIQYDGNKIHP